MGGVKGILSLNELFYTNSTKSKRRRRTVGSKVIEQTCFLTGMTTAMTVEDEYHMKR